MIELAEHLSAFGLTPEAAARARRVAEETGESIPTIVSRLGLLPDEVVVEALCAVYRIPPCDVASLPAQVIDMPVTPDFLKARRCLPVSQDSDGLRLAVVDPGDRLAADGVAFACDVPVQVFVIGFHAWRECFERLYREAVLVEDNESSAGARWTDDVGGVRDLTLDAPAVQLVEALISDAARKRASDIHIERKADAGLVRFRIDGLLEDIQRLSPAMSEAVVARLKVLADLDVANHRKPQDGRTALSAGGRPIDVRLSIIPGVHGEAAVIRLLDRRDIALDFAALGFSEAEAARIRYAIERPQGLFIVAGPTGGGKTTTLYSVINTLRSSDRKIVTVEDPIEYFFDDVHQTQLDAAAGLDFATALRAYLRHDPDVIMVGEIRDAETAKTAVQAALTGHLVLSTLHAKSAASVPTRLIEMGVDPYLVASTLTATTSQRLVRRLCEACNSSERVRGETSAGCPKCRGGFVGRMVISETLSVTPDVADAITQRRSLEEFVPSNLKGDGDQKVANGLTTRDEVLRAVELA